MSHMNLQTKSAPHIKHLKDRPSNIKNHLPGTIIKIIY